MSAIVHSNANSFGTGYFDSEINAYFDTVDSSKENAQDKQVDSNKPPSNTGKETAQNIGYFSKEGCSQWHGGMAKDMGLLGKPVNAQLATEFARGFINKETVGKIISEQEMLKIKQQEDADIAAGKMQPNQRMGIYEIPGQQGKYLAHRAGVEMVFSAPKSVSVLALVMQNKDVLHAHNTAIVKAIAYVEQEFSRTRIGKGGNEYVYGQKALFASYQHYTSRSNDPQLHNHVFMFNLAKDGNGKLRTQSNEEILKYQRMLGAFYRNELAIQMRQLGFGIESRPKGMWEVKGFAQVVLDHFSKRSIEVQTLINEAMKTNPMLTREEISELIINSRGDKAHALLPDLINSWAKDVKQLDGYKSLHHLQDKQQAIKNAVPTIVTEKFDTHQVIHPPVSSDTTSTTPKPTPSPEYRQRLSYGEISYMLDNNALAFCQRYLPDGFKDGAKHWRVGSINGEKGNSMVVDISGRSIGRWTDFSSGDIGDLMNILQHQTGNGGEAIKEAKAFLGISNTTTRLNVQVPQKDPHAFEQQVQAENAKKITAAHEIWDRGVGIQGSLAEKYLNARGISLDKIPDTSSMRFIDKLKDWDKDNKVYRPALVVAATDNNGKVTGVSRIYLNEQSAKTGKAVSKKMLGVIRESGVRFNGSADNTNTLSKQVIIGEGVETVLSIKQAYPDATVVATLSTSHMKNFQFAPNTTKVIVAADNDSNQAGLKAAQAVGENAANNDVNVYVYMPIKNDFNDDLRDLNTAGLENKLHSIYLGRQTSIKKHMDTNNQTDIGHAVRFAIDYHTGKSSIFETKAVIHTAMEHYPGYATYEEFWQVLKLQPDLRGDAFEPHNGQPRLLISKANFDMEREMRHMEHRNRGKGTVIFNTTDIETTNATLKQVDENDRGLTTGQQQALQTIGNSINRFVYINGDPGAGKSFMLGTLKSMLANKGYTIQAITNTNAAREVMKAEGIDNAINIATFLNNKSGYLEGRYTPGPLEHIRQQYKNTVLVIDEASMVGNKAMHSIMKLAELYQMPKVAIVGDVRQLEPVEAGNPFKMQVDMDNSHKVFMTENVRSKTHTQRLLVTHEKTHGVQKAFAFMQQHNMVQEMRSKAIQHEFAQRLSAIINAGEHAIGLAAKNEQVRALNMAVRPFLQGLSHQDYVMDKLDRRSMTVEEKQHSQYYSVGDIMAFDKAYRGQQIQANIQYEIAHIDYDNKIILLTHTDKLGAVHTTEFSPERVQKKNIRWDSYHKTHLRIAEGEELRSTKNMKFKDANQTDIINNGRFKVERIIADSNKVILSDMMHGEVREVALNGAIMQHMDYNYVMTVHAAQGATCDKVVSYLDGDTKALTNERHFTVAISRATDGGHFLTVDIDKTIKTIEAPREDRTATEAHRDGVNRPLDNPDKILSNTAQPPILQSDITYPPNGSPIPATDNGAMPPPYADEYMDIGYPMSATHEPPIPDIGIAEHKNLDTENADMPVSQSVDEKNMEI